MKVQINNDCYWLIGDVHMGRDFSNGTPIERRGERERRQLDRLVAELNEPCDVNVNVGDVFDKPFVPFAVVLSVVDAYIRAAKANPLRRYVILAGNHDLSRQQTGKGAFDVLERCLSWLDNVTIIREATVLDGVAYLPWDWFRTTTDQVAQLPQTSISAVIGHCDLQDFGGDTSHIFPAKALAEKFGEVPFFSGHYHLAGEYKVEGHTVHCTGSMEPYTHAEDPDGELYVTLTAEEALARDDLHDKCVRVLLQPGEAMPDIDCLQLTSKRVTLAVEDVPEIEVIDSFDIQSILSVVYQENNVPENVQTFIKERLGGSH